MQFAITLFEKMTALDAIGPYEVLQRLPGSQIDFVGHVRGEVRCDNGFLGLTVDKTFEEVTAPDIVVVPGGIGTRPLTKDQRMLGWLRQVHSGTRYTTSVCTGSLLLGAAGLLEGLPATSHFTMLPALQKYGAQPTMERVVVAGKVLTAAGVSSGIDMALRLAELLCDGVTAQALQLMIEYDPQPPYDSGALNKATPEAVARAQQLGELRD